MLIFNLKTYSESTSKSLEVLLEAIKSNPEYLDKTFVAPSIPDLYLAKSKYPEINFISQHADSKDMGSTTGWVPASHLMANGVGYAIINHSEHRTFPDLKLKELMATGLKLIVCCENVIEALKILEEAPVFAIAYEPKELIGSGISVTTRPEEVTKFVNAIKGKAKVIIGAGVTTGEDVKKSLELGAEGVLLASAFVKAADPVAKFKELVEPFNLRIRN